MSAKVVALRSRRKPPAAPAHLAPEAAEVWGTVAAAMVKGGTWRDEHLTLLEQYASAMGALRQADAAIARDGAYFAAPSRKPVAHPALKTKAEQAPIARALARALGLIPERGPAPGAPPAAVGEFGDLDL